MDMVLFSTTNVLTITILNFTFYAKENYSIQTSEESYGEK